MRRDETRAEGRVRRVLKMLQVEGAGGEVYGLVKGNLLQYFILFIDRGTFSSYPVGE